MPAPLKQPLAVLCTGVLLAVIALSVVVPMLSTWQAEATDWNAIGAAPSAEHWFGTDAVGRDLYVRVFAGGRLSLSVALLATLVSLLIGIPYGAVAGFFGGRTDLIMMRLVDLLYSIPFVLIVILLVVLVGRDTRLLFLGLGAVYWLDIARIVRGQTLRIRQENYIDAARALGGGRLHILLRHVVPNVLGPALVYATLAVPGIILAESFISFLGLGVQEPQTSWGVLVSDGTVDMEAQPWGLLFPCLVLSLTVWSANLLGDRLRDAMEVATRQQIS